MQHLRTIKGRAASYGAWALAALLMAAAGAAQAQVGMMRDDPTALSDLPTTPTAAAQSPAGRVLEAVCWYLPNRILDLTDVVRVHAAIGDGMGATVRATKYLWASWFHDNATCVGWTRRRPPVFGEQINERYFGFFAAREGELDRDPTEVGLSMHLLVIGVNVAGSLGELLDAAAGIVGVDLMGDDHGPVMFDYTTPPAAGR